MSSEIKYVNLPLETLKIALGMTRHGYKNRTDQENDKYHALNIISNLIYEQENEKVIDK